MSDQTRGAARGFSRSQAMIAGTRTTKRRRATHFTSRLARPVGLQHNRGVLLASLPASAGYGDEQSLHMFNRHPASGFARAIDSRAIGKALLSIAQC